VIDHPQQLLIFTFGPINCLDLPDYHIVMVDSLRIAIMGNSGSGKTTLARHLSCDQKATVLDLDTVAWEPNQIAVPRPIDLAREEVRDFCRSHERWIIEGCYAGLIEASLEFGPLLLVLDPGLEKCLTNCRSRPWEPHKYSSKKEQDEGLLYLLDWVEQYYSRDGDMSLAAHRSVFEHYGGPKEWLSALPRPDSGYLTNRNA